MIMFKVSVHVFKSTAFFKDTNRPEQEYIFLFSKTVFKLVLDLIKEKPLSRFTYLEELALKAAAFQTGS